MTPVSASGIAITIGCLPANLSLGDAVPPPAVSASVPTASAAATTIRLRYLIFLLLLGGFSSAAGARSQGSPRPHHLLRLPSILSFRARHGEGYAARAARG